MINKNKRGRSASIISSSDEEGGYPPSLLPLPELQEDHRAPSDSEDSDFQNLETSLNPDIQFLKVVVNVKSANATTTSPRQELRKQQEKGNDLVELEEEEVPKKRSRRENENEKKAEEGVVNIQKYGVKVPIGLNRIPFEFPKAHKPVDLQGNLKEVDKKKLVMTKPTIKAKRSRVGKLYQVDEADLELRINQPGVGPDRRRDELIWKAPEGMFNNGFFRYEYWKAIWRQFDGRIPLDTALQNLMKNDYCYSKSLENIDQTLQELPQKFQPLARCQVLRFEDLFKQLKEAREKEMVFVLYPRDLQERAMRNYHLGEVSAFYYQYKRSQLVEHHPRTFYDDPILDDVDFEPRWACSNCTEKFRRRFVDLPYQKTADLCLICKLYQKATGNQRPNDSVMFDDDDMEMIKFWNDMEAKVEKSITRKELEKMFAEETARRRDRQEFTNEENSILRTWDNVDSRRRTVNLTSLERQIRSLADSSKLEAQPLPLFYKFIGPRTQMTMKVRFADAAPLQKCLKETADTFTKLKNKLEEQNILSQVKRRKGG